MQGLFQHSVQSVDAALIQQYTAPNYIHMHKCCKSNYQAERNKVITLGVKTIDQELAHRREMWNLLLENGGPNGVAPEALRTLGIYGGAQGIWVDKARTGELTDDGHRITVSLTH